MPTALITGANRGIGYEFARQYAADGWRVVACCREPARAEDLRAVKGAVSIHTLDVTRLNLDSGRESGNRKRTN